jgi:hypothetical protein
VEPSLATACRKHVAVLIAQERRLALFSSTIVTVAAAVFTVSTTAMCPVTAAAPQAPGANTIKSPCIGVVVLTSVLGRLPSHHSAPLPPW